jgi:hypothetical protein
MCYLNKVPSQPTPPPAGHVNLETVTVPVFQVFGEFSVVELKTYRLLPMFMLITSLTRHKSIGFDGELPLAALNQEQAILLQEIEINRYETKSKASKSIPNRSCRTP